MHAYTHMHMHAHLQSGAGRLLTSGKCWGHDMILARQHLCHYAARAISYIEVYRISRSELLQLARPFPIALRRIRWEVTRLRSNYAHVHAVHMRPMHVRMRCACALCMCMLTTYACA